jgi:hypothetical protein
MAWLALQAGIILSCLLIMGMGAQGIRTGRVRGKGWSGVEILTGRLIYRDERPILFWFTVLAYLLCPPIIAVSVIMTGS